MTELKTLKDLKCCNIAHRDCGDSPTHEHCYVYYGEVKKLFEERDKILNIKIKRIQELLTLFKKEGFDLNHDWKEIKIHFFNLTEEDLKNDTNNG